MAADPLGMMGCWIPASSADPLLARMYERHYSCRNRNRRNQRFVGPGECMVLRTVEWDALWSWRLSRYRQDGRHGVECTIFRNEGRRHLSSDMIREAVAWARKRWPRMRLFTFVDPTAVDSPNPGACFRHAGWKRLKYTTARGLLEFEAPSHGC